ncbi:MAG: PocR ligand-binding domain-containing protein, partial [Clostridia bacterium]|nr:PocR ligand-binding domain-containing protein [Clostridia bacterium]
MLQIYDIDGLRELMEQFYILTGMRIVLFDEAHNEIASYPEKGIPFCSYMRLDADFDCKCRMSDKISFERCNQTNSLTIYKCHAGLIEATAPLTDNGNIIGYIMFGQIGDIRDKNNFLDNLLKSGGYYDTEDVIRNAKKIKFKSDKQITAAAKILETCTNYILIKEMVKQPRIHLITKIDRYIDENLEENLTVDS